MLRSLAGTSVFGSRHKASRGHNSGTNFRRGGLTGVTIWRDRQMMAATRPSIFSADRTLSGM